MTSYRTLVELQNEEAINRFVLPLLIETLLVLVICKSTVFDVIARRMRTVGQQEASIPSTIP